MKKTLLVSDLDGTLLRDDKTISEYTKNVLNRFIAAGGLFTYATARSMESSANLLNGVNLNIPAIVHNGTILANPADKKPMDICFFDAETLEYLANKALEYPNFCVVTVYKNQVERKNYLNAYISNGGNSYLEAHKNDPRLHLVNEPSALYDGDVCYFAYISAKEQLEPLYNAIKDGKGYNCFFYKDNYGEDYWLEISPEGATKAQAIDRLRKMVCADKLVVFGDSVNDISMFKTADESYAILNALPEVKNMATGIIGDNNLDGVARWIEENYM